MDVRVWGETEGRLIELLPSSSDDGFGVAGLPGDRARTTADRVRAALLNSGVLPEAPSALIRLEPAVRGGTNAELDVAIALTALCWAGAIGSGLGWILATGRLGLDGRVYARGVANPITLAKVVEECHTPLLGYERMFEGEG